MACTAHLVDAGTKRPMDLFTLRELGRAFHCTQQRTFDVLTCSRNLKPFIADTSPNCRSTYLLRLNPTQKLLAAAHGDRSISVYCALTGCLLAKCMGHERSPWTLAFHPSQPYLLASGCLGGGIRLWNLEGLADVNASLSQPVRTISCTKLWKHAGAIASLAFHPVHPILAVAWTQEVVFYDWVSGRKLSVWRFVSDQSRVRWVKFNPDGALLYTATANPSMSNPAESNEQPTNTTGIPDSFYSSDESSPAGTPTKPVYEAPVNDRRPPPSGIPRDMLLEFLVSQPDSWFQRLGVCTTCSVRLCRWAGTLRHEFPSTTVDVHRGACIARRVAELTGTTMKLAGAPISRLVQELSSFPDHQSDLSKRILLDVNPAAVAIIEDMPVKEFLLSRSHYCSTPSTVADGGLCCGGHACDLVLTHRKLMRHSICRPCLVAFWRWASRFVNWWCWSRESEASSVQSEFVVEPITKDHSQLGDITPYQIDLDRPLQTPNHPVGICLHCRARVSSHHKQAYEEHSSCFNLVASKSTDPRAPSFTRHSLPLAALELLRSRLSNANEVTPVTYMASDLIAEGNLSNYIRQSLTAPVPSAPPSQHLSALILRLLRHATLAHAKNSTGSPQLKRRKLNEDFMSSSPGDSPLAGTSDLHLRSSSSSSYQETTAHGVRDLTQEAVELARLLSNSSTDSSWNRPRPVRVVKRATHSDTISPSKLFPYVTFGSQLLRPTKSTQVCSSSSSGTSSSESTNDGFPTRVGSDELCAVDMTTDIVPNNETHSMTACCRCGRIVPQTFPIDPQSSLSAVVCEKLVLSDYHCSSPNRDNYSLTTARDWGSGRSGGSPRRTEHAPRRRPATEQSVDRSVSSHQNNSSLSMQQRNNSVMYLINRTNADSMLTAVHRSITEVIAGLFVDMGEHGSATCLQDATYRVCRWELNLRGPVHCSSSDCSPLSGRSDGASIPRSVLPMPANVAVSYNTNSLVIPHVRLFNDSSICLSPDGRMLAAFVVPSANRNERTGTHTSVDRSSTSSDTLLAVYRLQPKQHRGHCLFARRFTTTNPVCLDFSPLGDYLAVGMATTRLPSVPLPSSSLRRLSANRNSAHGELPSVGGLENPDEPDSTAPNLVPLRHASIAQIFRLNRRLERADDQERRKTSVRWSLEEVTSVMHPMFLNPVSCSRKFTDSRNSTSTASLDRWHRLLLSASTGISLNTIVWNPNGGLFYGTTKGLVVLMGTQPLPIIPLEGNEHATESSFVNPVDEKKTDFNQTLTSGDLLIPASSMST